MQKHRFLSAEYRETAFLCDSMALDLYRTHVNHENPENHSNPGLFRVTAAFSFPTSSLKISGIGRILFLGIMLNASSKKTTSSISEKEYSCERLPVISLKDLFLCWMRAIPIRLKF